MTGVTIKMKWVPPVVLGVEKTCYHGTRQKRGGIDNGAKTKVFRWWWWDGGLAVLSWGFGGRMLNFKYECREFIIIVNVIK